MSELCTLAASVVLQSSASEPELSSPASAIVDTALMIVDPSKQPSVGCKGHHAIVPSITPEAEANPPEVRARHLSIEGVEFSQAQVLSGEQRPRLQPQPIQPQNAQTNERLQMSRNIGITKGYSPSPGEPEYLAPGPSSRASTTVETKPKEQRLTHPPFQPNPQSTQITETQADSEQTADAITTHNATSIPARWPSLLYGQPQTEPLPQAALPFMPETTTRPEINRPLQPSILTTPSRTRPQSGRQLYQQRWAALRAGKTYTRLPSDSFEAQWKNARHNPTYEDWLYLLSQEARSMAAGQGDNALTIIVGDSLSLWMPTEFLPQHRFWLNQSISGETAAAMVKRLHMFDQANPDTIHVMAGINDLKNGASDAEVLGALQTMMKQLRHKHPEAEVIIHSILPTRLPHLPSDRIHGINRQLANIASQEGVTFLNLQGYFSDTEGHLRHDLTTDGLHLNYRGYTMWQTAINQLV